MMNCHYLTYSEYTLSINILGSCVSWLYSAIKLLLTMSYPFPPGGGFPSFNISYRTVPLSYYSDLRQSDLPYQQVKNTSKIAKVTLENDDDIRLLHLAQLMPLTIPGSMGFDMFGPIRKPNNDIFLHWEAAGLLALVHFNERNTSVLPELSDLLANCNVHLTMDLLDTQLSPVVSSEQYYRLAVRNNTLASPQPGGLVGGAFSYESQPLATLTGAYQIPQISPASTAGSLEFNDDGHLFSRTVPTNTADGFAVLELLLFWNVSHVGALFSRDEYGVSFAKDFENRAIEKGITVISTGFNLEEDNSISKAVRLIKESGVRYILGIPANPSIAQSLLVAAYDDGLVGETFVWILTQTGFTYPLPRNDETEKFAKALKGAAVVEIEVTPDVPFLLAMSDIRTDTELREFFVNSHPESFIFDDFLWNESYPIVTTFSYTTYDAVMAMGIAACQTPVEFFTGQQHFDALKKLEFRGVSGQVAFTSTGTRRYDGLKYVFSNVFLNEELWTNDTIVIKSEKSILIDFSNQAPVLELVPFLFYNGSTSVPLALPEYKEDLNMIGQGILIFGWVLTSLVMLMAIGLGLFTYKYRNTNLIRAAQPLFLGMMCMGCFILASAVVPMSMQEPLSQNALNAACMSTPWLLSIGFCTAFSALFTKTYRIQKLFTRSLGLQRSTVLAKDVLWTLIVLTLINVFILTLWTILGPLEWRRVEVDNRDQFGRSMETYGVCRSSNGLSVIFLALLVLFNFLTVAFANFQLYISRHIPSDFNESYYIALTMTSLLELFLIGLPILFLVSENPAADFMVRTVLVCFCCCSILGPIFASKLRVGKNRPLDTNAMQMAWGTYMSAAVRSRTAQRSKPTSSAHQSSSGQKTPRGSIHLQPSSDDPDADATTLTQTNGTVAEIRANIERKQRAHSQQMSLDETSDEGGADMEVAGSNHNTSLRLSVHQRKRSSVSSKESQGSVSSGSDLESFLHGSSHRQRNRHRLDGDIFASIEKSSHKSRTHGTVAEIRANVERKKRALLQQKSPGEVTKDGPAGMNEGWSGLRSASTSRSQTTTASRHPSDVSRSRSNSADLLDEEADSSWVNRASNQASRKLRAQRGQSIDSFKSSADSFVSSFESSGDEFEMDLKTDN
jgi:ABC-type branched-subunit amino acid transport system substrate-binding protein